MATDKEKDVKEAAAHLQAGRLGMVLPEPAVAGVVANLELLAGHHTVLSDALAKAPPSA